MQSTISSLPQGLGFGAGTISKKTRIKNKEIDEAALEAARAFIRNPANYPLVEFGDDGCGDGRGTGVTFKKESGSAAIDGTRRTFQRSGHRAKVFGGGLIMTWIMDRIVRGEPQLGDSVLTDRAVAAQKLSQARIGFGGHTDNHASGEASGCGAIDKTPQILQAAQTFQDEIESTLRVVLGNHFEQAVYDKVLALFGSLSENSDYLADAQGSKTSRLLEDSNAVLKELHGSHNEAFVILNYVPGTTFNQAALNALTNDVIQAFAVDAWRIDAYSDIVSRWHNAVTDSYKTALHAGFMYTIAAASVLTDGTQEIFVRKPRNMLTPGV